MLSLFLGARNLSLASQYRLPVVTPCPSCYISLKRILKLSKEDKFPSEQINELLAKEHLAFSADVEVFHSLEFLVSVVGLDTIGSKVRNPLRGFKIAPYYGCQLVCPHVNGSKSSDPQDLEKLIEVLGAQPVEFPFRTHCCGGSLMFTFKDQAEKLSCMILKSIQRTDTDLIVTPCGLCQLNLEIAQKRIWGKTSGQRYLPIVNIGQLMGQALVLGPRRIYTDKKKILTKRGIRSTTN